jgi:hypothetical protein
LLEKVIDKYGVIKAFDNDFNKASTTNDYLFFCITKSFRSLSATKQLINTQHFEDSFVLIRSAFEAYLHASHLLKNPNQIFRFINIKLGAYLNELEHPKTSKGTALKHKVIIPNTNKEIPIDISLKKLSNSTLSINDHEFYEIFYPYLSEYAHMHMIAMGNYADYNKKKFLTKSNWHSKIFETIMFSLIVSWMLLDVLLAFNVIKAKSKKHIKKQLFESGLLIYNYVQSSNIEQEQQQCILKRLNEFLKLEDV